MSRSARWPNVPDFPELPSDGESMTEEQFQACRAWVRDIDQRRTALRSKMADLRAAVDEYARLDAQLQGLAPEAGRTAFFEAKYALSQELLRRELTRAD